MNSIKLSNLKKELSDLFDRFNLLNLWMDLIKIMTLNLNFFLKNGGKSFWTKLNLILKKYNIENANTKIFLEKEYWKLKIKLSNKQNIIILIKYKKWNYQYEKEMKMIYLRKLFSEEIKKISRVKKCLLVTNEKKIIYPISNKNYPIFPISEIIKSKFFNVNTSSVENNNFKLTIENLLSILNICSDEKIKDFYNFLCIMETRFINKIENELLPFINNINLIYFKNHIDKIYYYDSPDFILINNFIGMGVEVTNIKHKNDYYINQCHKETLLRALINPNCFYSKKFFYYKQQQKHFYNKNFSNDLNFKIESLSRHFSNNNKYNETIRQNGLKVKRGQKNFYILNGWDEANHLYQKKLIKNIAIKKNIPFKKLIFLM